MGVLPQASQFVTILAHFSRQNRCDLFRLAGLLAHTHIFISACKNYRTEIRACEGHLKTLNLLSLSHFVSNFVLCLGSLSFKKTHLCQGLNFMADVWRCYFNISIMVFLYDGIYFVHYGIVSPLFPLFIYYQVDPYMSPPKWIQERHQCPYDTPFCTKIPRFTKVHKGVPDNLRDFF